MIPYVLIDVDGYSFTLNGKLPDIEENRISRNSIHFQQDGTSSHNNPQAIAELEAAFRIEIGYLWKTANTREKNNLFHCVQYFQISCGWYMKN